MADHKAHDNTKADPEQIDDAWQMWAGFCKLMKWSTIATIAVLVLLALLFV